MSYRSDAIDFNLLFLFWQKAGKSFTIRPLILRITACILNDVKSSELSCVNTWEALVFFYVRKSNPIDHKVNGWNGLALRKIAG